MNAPLAVTMGEPAGVGGELALAAWLNRNRASHGPFYLLDDPARLSGLARHLGLQVPLREIERPAAAEAVFPRALPVRPIELPITVTPGRPDAAAAVAVLASIRTGVADCLAGEAAGLVTGPIQKSTLYAAGFAFPGHTEFLADLTAAPVAPVMMLASRELRVVPATIHIPLAAVAAALTVTGLVETGRTLAASLRRDFGLSSARIAVTGLNPHAGEDGALGREEIEIISPAIAALRAEGLAVDGPFPADTLFEADRRRTYDAALCMYHDQALIPLKTLDPWGGVNITLGLPLVRTSPDHGTALDMAGSGKANPGSLIAALDLARRIARRRGAG